MMRKGGEEVNEIHKRKLTLVCAAAQSGLLDKCCTPLEIRRIRAYYLEGLPLREVARREGVGIPAVCRSIRQGMERLQRERGFF